MSSTVRRGPAGRVEYSRTSGVGAADIAAIVRRGLGSVPLDSLVRPRSNAATPMTRSRHVTVRIDLARVRSNAEDVKRRVGPGVELIAVVKADAYGLGIRPVAKGLADVADRFCVFSLEEAVEAELWALTGKPTLALSPPRSLDPDDYTRHGVRPAVMTVEQAAALRGAGCVLCVDTGMQRFACRPEDVGRALEAGGCAEAFTHAARL